MKLYTEMQVNELRRALRDIVQWDEYLADDWENVEYRAMDALKAFNQITPIELPSDEEIQEYLKSFPYTKHLDDGQYNDGVIVGADLAIQWMFDKIQGGNNE